MPPVIEAQALVKRFGEVTAVNGLDIAVERGEVFGLLGPNGAGKTTTIRMITGLLAPTEGVVRINGHQVRANDPEVRARVGVAFQDNVFWELLTCRENLVFAADMYGVPRATATTRADTLLSKLGLTDKAGAHAGTLSGGMKRRLNVALALVHDPEIVILDEPEAGLDPQARVVLREFIQGLAKEKTMIVTTHNMDEAERIADRIAIVDHGKVIALDTPAGLKRSIGEGDVVEIHVSGDPRPVAARIMKAGLGEAKALESEVHVRGLDLAARFGGILQEVEASGAEVVDVRYRGNSLEDVFITLTGRGMRE